MNLLIHLFGRRYIQRRQPVVLRWLIVCIFLLRSASAIAQVSRTCPCCGLSAFWPSQGQFNYHKSMCCARRNPQSIAPSQIQPSHPHVHRTSDGKLAPDEGYFFAKPNDPNDYSVIYAPHVHRENGKLTPDTGHLWAVPDSADDYSVIYAPHVHREDGLIVADSGYLFTDNYDLNDYAVRQLNADDLHTQRLALPIASDQKMKDILNFIRGKYGIPAVDFYFTLYNETKEILDLGGTST